MSATFISPAELMQRKIDQAKRVVRITTRAPRPRAVRSGCLNDFERHYGNGPFVDPAWSPRFASGGAR